MADPLTLYGYPIFTDSLCKDEAIMASGCGDIVFLSGRKIYPLKVWIDEDGTVRMKVKDKEA